MGLMEAALVSGILRFLGNKLAPLQFSEYISIVDGKSALMELKDNVEEVNHWLETVGDKAPGSWLAKLKDFAYAVDSFVDELQLKAQKHDTSGIMSKYMCTIPRSFIFQTKVKAIKKKFAAFNRQRADFSALTISSLDVQPVRHINKIIGERETVSFVDKISVVGRDQDKHYIVSKLVETNDQHDIIIVSIIGLGGSGKTTLAQLVFNENIIGSHFEVRVWIHVSLEFEKVLMKLFEAITGETPRAHSLSHIANTTSSMLRGKRFLIVLDDIWTEDIIEWAEFMVHLKNCAPGSRILLTTRSKRVVKAVQSTYMLNLGPLSLDDSWILFQETLGTTLQRFSELEGAGRAIVEKCGGVPLAIKALAGVLRGKEQIEEWHAIRDGNLLDAEDRGHIIFESLILSYFTMPSHLKQCFTICSVFPKGYRIDKEKLIDLWIAHDMVTPEFGADLEYIGDNYFDFLVQISFLQDVAEDRYGRVTCTMHDLVHYLALAIMDEEILTLLPKVATSSTKRYRYFSVTEQPRNLLSENRFEEARAVYVSEGDYFKFGRALENAKHLRSITVRHTESVPTTILQVKILKYLEISGLKCEELPEAISNIWSLQALQVTNCDIINLPNSIGNLQNLRTLNLSWCKRLKSLPGSVSSCLMISNMDLSGCVEFEVLPDFNGTNKRLRVLRVSHTKIERLPSNITSLENLECLDLQWCRELVELPEGIENLGKLRVLNLEGCKLRIMPKGIGKLNRILIPSTFVVAEDDNSARISELGNIWITGDLTIRGIACVMNPDDAHGACLKDKTDLQKLQLHWGRTDAHKERNVEDIFDALQPPSGIKELYISEYEGARCARWMLNQVSNGVQGHPQFPFLTVMTLYGFQKLNNLEGLMELPCLEELKLQWMPLLTTISGGPFPKLAKLRMEGLPSLGEVRMADGTLADGDGDGDGRRMKIGECLTDLHIEECPKLILKWCFPSSIEHLVLKRSNNQLLLLPGQGHGEGPSSSFSFPPSCSFSQLKELELWGIAASSSSPPEAPGSGSKHAWELLQHMTALKSFKICQCGGLTGLPDSMRSLTSLRSLLINFCSAIFMLPEWLGELRFLQNMTIQSCHSLSSLQSIGNLASLQELRIERCDELLQLPESLGELCSLRRFNIASLQGVTFLPKSMCCLNSLEELEISDCQGLTSLPEWIKDLPALQKLKITGCPELERRCEKQKGSTGISSNTSLV